MVKIHHEDGPILPAGKVRPRRGQSAEARLAALREGMEGLAGELEAEATNTAWNPLIRNTWATDAARIRAVLEGKT